MFSFFALQELQNRDQQQADFDGLLTAEELRMLEKVEFENWFQALDADTDYINGVA